jgi:anti-sigma regulatory factor (Ser/Thr protein kinase)
MEADETSDAELRRFELTVPKTASSIRRARQAFEAFLRLCGFTAQVQADVILALGEAMANAVEHGFQHGGKISIRAEARADGLEIVMSEDGAGFAPGPRPVRPPEAGAPRGFGIFLMYRLMDDVQFEANGTTVRLFKKAAPGP